ncbi:MAG: murein transglycosylase [Sedimenticola selenatireducens]|uniref:Murein transglycosylase n=1 Tax=Sedimenticola selenatireducens TaxID=191960 RepID=A0A557SMA1_9GAMM|nr:murein transglycosylase [Sedimenticola selenatireducens]TVT62661.1 MAG: murein transglycosylase [Sedimenticola selenatireducens]
MPMALCNSRINREVQQFKRGSVLPILLCLLFLFPGTGFASQDLDTQRKAFLAAERILATGDLNKFNTLKTSLKDYPLYPYLEYKALRLQLAKLDSSQVDAFITTYADSPLSRQMRRVWLSRLADKGKWWTYLVFYRPNLGTTLQCHYLTALMETGKAEKALKQAKTIWLHPRSRPDECDTILETWINAGLLTPELAWKRVALAMQASQGRFALYLKRYLSPEQQATLDLWRELQRDPVQAFNKPQPLLEGDSAHNAIMLDSFKRLARRDVDAALDIWQKNIAHLPFSKEQHYQAQRALMLGLIRNDHPDLLAHLGNFTPTPDDERLHESRLRGALKQQAWPQILAWINELPDSLKHSDRWRYWEARAKAETGNKLSAQSTLQALAKERSYHGFLAADLVDQAYRYDSTPLDLEQSGIDHLAKRPGLMRARELFQLGRFVDARREWQMSIRQLNRLDLKRVSKLAQSWGWHDRAIFTLARTGYWDDLELRFPLEHMTLVEEKSNAKALDNAWIFAVMRQESAFSSDAQSPAGAMGLMQLMPATAKFIARIENIRAPKKAHLVRPELNITLGTAYLNHVYQQLGTNQVLATAAYNAGPNNVRKWLPEATLPADIWVELIPFNETRRYTERVLSYAAIYDQRLNQPLQRLSMRMSPIHPRSQLAAKEVNGKDVAL